MNEKDINTVSDDNDFDVLVQKYSKTDDEPEAVVTEEKEKSAPVPEKQKSAFPTKKVIIAVVAVVAVLLISFGTYAFTLPTDTVLGGVTVNGIEIGGLTCEEAAEKLFEMNFDDSATINLTSNGKVYPVELTEIDAVIDTEETVNRAFNFAKDGNRVSNTFTALSALVTGKDIAPAMTYNKDKLSAIINQIGTDILGGPMIGHSVRMTEDGKAFIVPGKPGYSNNPEDILKQIDTALNEDLTTDIELVFNAATPEKLTIEALDALMYKDPVNASFAIENGAVIVKPEETGRYIDKEYCKSLLPAINANGTDVEIPYSPIPAGVTAESLQGKLFNAKLGSYTTRFNAGSVNRTENIRNASSKINGKILLPGEKFSFNETVGRRTVDNGFKPAPEYQNGQTVTGIGGGTCQVSTTVYSAALYAGLQITRRSNHSMSVSYVPLGQDATVTDGGIDLQFVNNTDYPVRIDSTVSGGSITVSFTGTAPESPRTIKIVHTPISALQVKSERITYDANGNIISSESLGTSRYKPHEDTSSSAAPAAPSPTAAPSETTAPTDATPEPEGPTGNVTPPSEPVQDNPATKAPAATKAPVATQAPVEVPVEKPIEVPVKSEE